MKAYILKRKKAITVINAILIVFGFVGRFALENITIFNVSLFTASIIGVAPIVIQAYQALRVKVVSIDLLVTIAVIGAILIGNYEESA
ncbi:MAG TPA: cation-transporting P-type ATPase, partial [Candidatus Avamphibacillus intestinigallinarum]|nr:cation-transporting P-type ATPase [Candidatus Avamphibacillus intestinigallinarum]